MTTTSDRRNVERMRRSTTADRIKEFILTKGLHPGDALPSETELCDTLEVSRSSVREAIRALNTLDIVEVRHGRGTFVGNMSMKAMVQSLVFRGVLTPGDDLRALRDVVEIRQALELAMADQIVAAHCGTTNEELTCLVQEMVDHADAGETFLEADRAFHTTFLDSIENCLAGQLVGAFWDVHAAVLPRLGLALPSDLRRTAKAHGAMLLAAQAGDVAAFRSAVVQHYEPLHEALRDGM